MEKDDNQILKLKKTSMASRMQKAIDALKASNDIIGLLLRVWKAYNVAKKVMIEKLAMDEKINVMDFAEREEYNQYISNYFKNQFEKFGMGTDSCELLEGMSVQKVWDRLDTDIREQIIQAELLSDVYRDTGFDQSPSCNPYCTAFEAIINRKAVQPVIKAMQKLHPEYIDNQLKNLGYDKGIINHYDDRRI